MFNAFTEKLRRVCRELHKNKQLRKQQQKQQAHFFYYPKLTSQIFHYIFI